MSDIEDEVFDEYEEDPADEPVEEQGESDEEDDVIIDDADETIAAAGDKVELHYVNPNNRRTTNIMSLQEMTEYVSLRATDIAKHNNCFVPTDDLDDPIDMAKRELMARKAPLCVLRHVGVRQNGPVLEQWYEVWSPNEMQFSQKW